MRGSKDGAPDGRCTTAEGRPARDGPCMQLFAGAGLCLRACLFCCLLRRSASGLRYGRILLEWVSGSAPQPWQQAAGAHEKACVDLVDTLCVAQCGHPTVQEPAHNCTDQSEDKFRAHKEDGQSPNLQDCGPSGCKSGFNEPWKCTTNSAIALPAGAAPASCTQQERQGHPHKVGH